MYGPGAVGVGEWYVYESVSGFEGPGVVDALFASCLMWFCAELELTANLRRRQRGHGHRVSISFSNLNKAI